MTPTSPPPHSETLNGGKGKKTIRLHSYSSNTTTVDFFMFQRGEIGAGRPLAVPGRPHYELRGGRPNHQQKQDRFQLSAVTKSTSKYALIRPKKFSKQARF
jgi:hypothetical protein